MRICLARLERAVVNFGQVKVLCRLALVPPAKTLCRLLARSAVRLRCGGTTHLLWGFTPNPGHASHAPSSARRQVRPRSNFWRAELVIALIGAATPVFADTLPAGGKAARGGAGQSVTESHRLRAIHIDTNTVLCIAQMGIQPSGKPVPQKGKRPAGLALFGVSALGVGVLDGDILTDVLGQPVRSQFQVIAMVMAARSSNMSTISGTLWRGLRSFSVTVDQPYDFPNCPSDDPECWRAKCKEVTQSKSVAVPTTSPPPKAKVKAANKR